jgi:hypothetical protein
VNIRLAWAVMAVAVAGCATPAPTHLVWLRSDGKLGDDPALAQQFEADRSSCSGATGNPSLTRLNPLTPFMPGNDAAIEMERGPLANDPMRRCMAEKGYVLVRDDERIQRASVLQAAAAENARREAAQKKPPASAKRTNAASSEVVEAR